MKLRSRKNSTPVHCHHESINLSLSILPINLSNEHDLDSTCDLSSIGDGNSVRDLSSIPNRNSIRGLNAVRYGNSISEVDSSVDNYNGNRIHIDSLILNRLRKKTIKDRSQRLVRYSKRREMLFRSQDKIERDREQSKVEFNELKNEISSLKRKDERNRIKIRSMKSNIESKDNFLKSLKDLLTLNGF